MLINLLKYANQNQHAVNGALVPPTLTHAAYILRVFKKNTTFFRVGTYVMTAHARRQAGQNSTVFFDVTNL